MIKYLYTIRCEKFACTGKCVVRWPTELDRTIISFTDRIYTRGNRKLVQAKKYLAVEKECMVNFFTKVGSKKPEACSEENDGHVTTSLLLGDLLCQVLRSHFMTTTAMRSIAYSQSDIVSQTPTSTTVSLVDQ